MASECLRQIDELLTIYSSSFETYILSLPKWVEGCYSDYPLESVKQIRRIVSIKNPPLEQVINTGVIIQIIKLLQGNNYNFHMLFAGYIREMNFEYVIPNDIINCIDKICIMYCIDEKLQNEGRWILTNIASGTTEQTQYIVDNGAIPILLNGMKIETSIQIKINSIQALGNIVTNNVTCRNLLLDNDINNTILQTLTAFDNAITIFGSYPPAVPIYQELFQLIAWTLSNLCRGKPEAEFKCNKLTIMALNKLSTINDTDIIKYVTYAMSYLTDTDRIRQLQMLSRVGLIQKCVSWLEHKSAQIRYTAVRVIANLSAGSDQQTQDLIDYGVLDKLKKLTNIKNTEVKRQICWVLSNITAGTVQQVTAVFDSGLFVVLMNMMNNEKYSIAKEALWAIRNAVTNVNNSQMDSLVKEGIIKNVCEFMRKIRDNNHLIIALDAIERIMHFFPGYRRDIIECGGLEYMKSLMTDENDFICDDAQSKILMIVNKVENFNHVYNQFANKLK